MTGSATAACIRYLTEIKATTEKVKIPKRVVQFAKFLCGTTHRDLRQLSTRQRAHATTCSATAARNGYLAKVQATTEKL